MSVSLLKTNENNYSRCADTCVHGSCELGSCICEVKYSGHGCKDLNLGYYIGFGVVFYMISAIAFFQLIFCIRGELKRMNRPRFWKACHLTIQKLLYLYVVVAAGSRGLYYTTELALPGQWRVNLFAVYYPFVICCFTAIICFWAEAFHLANWTADKDLFLKKSAHVFFVFNLFVFSVMIAQLISMKAVTDSNTLMLLSDVFSGCFIFLMFTVLVFFLVYGIEIFCKVQGAFTTGSDVFNWTQLNMSRFGLVAQAFFQLSAAVFFLCDVLQRKWKYRTDVTSRNAVEIVSRISELAVALWFPCVLWNCMRPKELWILNPKKIIRRSAAEEAIQEEETRYIMSRTHSCYDSIDEDVTKDNSSQHDCWVCYDLERTDAGPLIFPCNCIGDVAAVHHECLKRWIMEVMQESVEAPRCRVCRKLYAIKEEKAVIPWSKKIRHCLQTFFIVVVMVSLAAGIYRFCVDYQSTLSRVCFVGTSLLIECFLFRWLGFTFVAAYRRVRMASIVVRGRSLSTSTAEDSP